MITHNANWPNDWLALWVLICKVFTQTSDIAPVSRKAFQDIKIKYKEEMEGDHDNASVLMHLKYKNE